MTPPLNWFRKRTSTGKPHLVELQGQWMTSLCGYPLTRKPTELVRDDGPHCSKCERELKLRALRQAQRSQAH